MKYTLKLICSTCKIQYGSKETDLKENDGKESHGFCRPCLIIYCKENDIPVPEIN